MSAATSLTDETLQLRLKALHLPSFLEHYLELAERAAAEGCLLPAVVALLRDTVLPTQLDDRRTQLGLLQNRSDLLN